MQGKEVIVDVAPQPQILPSPVAQLKSYPCARLQVDFCSSAKGSCCSHRCLCQSELGVEVHRSRRKAKLGRAGPVSAPELIPEILPVQSERGRGTGPAPSSVRGALVSPE